MTLFEGLRLLAVVKVELVPGDLATTSDVEYTCPAGKLAVLIFNSYEVDAAAAGGKTWRLRATKTDGSTYLYDLEEPVGEPDRLNNSAPADLYFMTGQVLVGNGGVLGDVRIDITILEYELP